VAAPRREVSVTAAAEELRRGRELTRREGADADHEDGTRHTRQLLIRHGHAASITGPGRRIQQRTRRDCMCGMTENEDRVVSASRRIGAPAERIFELIADPSRQPEWDGNDNLGQAAGGQRVRVVGDVFVMVLSKGTIRENHVVEFEEGRRIAWRPAPPGEQPPGHLWRWTLEPVDETHTLVTHTYDWTELTDVTRLAKARATTADNLHASLDRLAEIATR